MAYRLKDRELQKKLDALTDDSKFSDQLPRCYEIAVRDGRFADDERFNVWFGEQIGKLYKYIAAFKQDEVEEITEYNPHAWNKYPEVTPPYDVLMRCEEDTENGTEHLCMKYVQCDDGDYWADEKGMGVWNCDRFRPWED